MNRKPSIPPLAVYSFCLYLFLYLPLLVLVIFSFNQTKSTSIWTGFSVVWYSALLDNERLLTAAFTSLKLALFSALFSTILGTVTAYSLHKYQLTYKPIITKILQIQIITPDIIFAVGLLIFYIGINFSLGLYSVLLAHITFNSAFTTLIISARFSNMNTHYEDAARDLGASSLQVFTRITLPLIRPGILAAFLLSVSLSWDDFIVSFFTSGVGTTTLPVYIYSMIRMGVNPQINAISALMLLFTLVLILVSLRFQDLTSIYSDEKKY